MVVSAKTQMAERNALFPCLRAVDHYADDRSAQREFASHRRRAIGDGAAATAAANDDPTQRRLARAAAAVAATADDDAARQPTIGGGDEKRRWSWIVAPNAVAAASMQTQKAHEGGAAAIAYIDAFAPSSTGSASPATSNSSSEYNLASKSRGIAGKMIRYANLKANVAVGNRFLSLIFVSLQRLLYKLDPRLANKTFGFGRISRLFGARHLRHRDNGARSRL